MAVNDETKGDGMTLAQACNELRHNASLPLECRDIRSEWFHELADAIDAHLAAQSAMRVDEVIAGTDGTECACPRAKAAELLAALQAAIGG